MKRIEVLNLYNLVKDLELPEIENYSEFVLTMVKLMNIYTEFETIKQQISEQTKPKDWKQDDDSEEWQTKFESVMNKWLSEDIDINIKILNNDDLTTIFKVNKLKIGTITVLQSLLLKE